MIFFTQRKKADNYAFAYAVTKNSCLLRLDVSATLDATIGTQENDPLPRVVLVWVR